MMDPYNIREDLGLFYRPPYLDVWQGRIDDLVDRRAFRWHQVIQPLDLVAVGIPEKPQPGYGFCFIGFAVDEGVIRNQGREGARRGPLEIRRGMANFPVQFPPEITLLDLGDIVCPNRDLIAAQTALRRTVALVLKKGYFPIVLGGGHEQAWSSWSALQDALLAKGEAMIPACINFDAHLDLRPEHTGPSSGTMFRQIAENLRQSGHAFDYTCIGVQRSANTQALFDYAREINARVVLARSMRTEGLGEAENALQKVLQEGSPFHATVCCDVFASAHAPGVSAPQPLGLDPETVLTLLRPLFASPQLQVFDVAEVLPRFDDDHLTARLAAILLFSLINTRSEAVLVKDAAQMN